jgi:aminoglycoside phosphotransferase (APT) family kinase protein
MVIDTVPAFGVGADKATHAGSGARHEVRQWMPVYGIESTLEPNAIARMLAMGGTFQELTASTPLVAPNQVFRIWRRGRSFVLKVYGSDARERRERHALDALEGLGFLPRIADRGAHGTTRWILFEDAGQWNLRSLPENPGFAKRAGEIVRRLHEVEATSLSNLTRGIDGEWIALDFTSTVKRVERYRSRLGVSQDLIDTALALNPPYGSPARVSHTDPVLRNFIVDDDGLMTLIDWEWATLAPPEWDLTKLVWSASMHAGPAAAEAVVEGYGRSVDRIQLDRWIVYHAAQTLVRYAERHLSARPGDVPDNLVAEFDRAVLGSAP